MNDEQLERIVPTQKTLEEFFIKFPDHKQRYDLAKSMVSTDMNVADCACGVGYGTYLLTDNVKTIIGFDISDDALKHANNHFKLQNNSFIHADNILDSKFDFIISFETIEHMDENAGDVFLTNFKNVLKPGGKLLISTPLNKTNKKHNVTPYHIREYDDYEFPEKLVNNGFKVIKMYGQGSDFHKKLYKNNSGISLFSIIKLGLHRFLPIGLRNKIKNIILGNPNENLILTTENWRNSFIQIALCELEDNNK